MKHRADFEYENDAVKRYIDGDVAVLKLKKDVFTLLTDLETLNEYFALYDWLEHEAKIRALLVLLEEGVAGEEAYRKFLGEIAGRDIAFHHLKSPKVFEHQLVRSREIHILQRTILRFVNFKKITILALQGSVVTPFFGISLAADFRVAAPEMSFSLSHVKYGLHPSGGLAFFLPRYLGQGKATQLLLKGGDIAAQEALELGLIGEILPKEDFEKHCVQAAQHLCRPDLYMLQSTKRLTNLFKDELQRHFSVESELVDFHTRRC